MQLSQGSGGSAKKKSAPKKKHSTSNTIKHLIGNGVKAVVKKKHAVERAVKNIAVKAIGVGVKKVAKSTHKEKKPGKSIMETTTAKKNALKTLAGNGANPAVPKKKSGGTPSKKDTPSKKGSTSKGNTGSKSGGSTSKGKSTGSHSSGGTSSGKRVVSSGGSKSSGGTKSTGTTSSTTTKTTKTAQTDAQKLKAMAKALGDSYYKNAKSGNEATRTRAIRDLTNAYNTEVASTNKEKVTLNEDYNDSIDGINKEAYKDSKMTDLYAYENGIQNSAQLLGLRSGDNQRTNDAKGDVLDERNKRIGALNDRLATLLTTKNQGVLGANQDYNNANVQARSQADLMYNTEILQQTKDAQAIAREDALRKQQMASSGGGGGGSYGRQSTGGTSKGGTNTGGKAPDLSGEYKEYQKTRQQTAIDGYNKRMQSYQKPASVVNTQKSVGMPYPTVRDNPNLSSWQKYRMITGQSYS